VTGFSEAERHIIGNVARYHRGAPPKERHPDYAALGAPDRETVCRLAAILRVADALDRSHDNRVQDLRCVREGQLIDLQLHSAHPCDDEIRAAELRSDLFEQVFDCRLTFSRRTLARRA
jgi:exopolyphosphatase/guanosine-5'-triphosphate,3'-diphosphate pyrophosphatase